MPRTGQRLVPLVLGEVEGEALGRLVRRRNTAQELWLRARIVLRCAERLASRDVARQLGVRGATVCK